MKNDKNKPINAADNRESKLDEGYPLYPENEDVYYKELKEDLAGTTYLQERENEGKGVWDGDLLVPGAELDDADEKTGNEDEENNYYSLGGDNHNDLEEDKGE